MLAWVFSLGPMAATVIYCISDDGHSGFEVVASGERGCASCCHEEEGASGHDGLGPPAGECTDVTLTSPQAVSGCASFVPANLAQAFDSLAIAPFVTGVRSVQFVRAEPFAPPRGCAAMLQRSTVLLI